MTNFSLEQFNNEVKAIQEELGIPFPRSVRIEYNSFGGKENTYNYSATVFYEANKCHTLDGPTPEMVYLRIRTRYAPVPPAPGSNTVFINQGENPERSVATDQQ